MAVFYPEYPWLWYLNGVMTSAMAAGSKWRLSLGIGSGRRCIHWFCSWIYRRKSFKSMYERTNENPELAALRKEPATYVQWSLVPMLTRQHFKFLISFS